MRAMYRLFVLAALVSGGACAGDATGNGGPPDPGTLILRLTTAHADDGAVLFELKGPAIESVVAVNASVRVFTRRVNDSTTVAAAVGVVANGAVATVRVPDARAAAAYTARVLDVADRQNVLRSSLAGYALTVEP